MLGVMQEEKEQEAYLKRRALAAKVEAQKAADELELQRQRDLQWFQDSINTSKVVGQFLFELCVKALPLPSLTAGTQASQKHQHDSKRKAANKGTPRFL